MYFVKPAYWEDLVNEMSTLELYKDICFAMFENEILSYEHDERLHILELLCRDICEKYPEIANDVWKYFCKVWTSIVLL